MRKSIKNELSEILPNFRLRITDNFHIKKLTNLKKPKDKKEQIMYNVILKKSYELLRSMVYIVTRIPKKSRSTRAAR